MTVPLVDEQTYDAINHPRHYNAHPSGVEVITITEHLNFCLGNAVKYILRADYKGKPDQDLQKAIWYLRRELDRRERERERLGQGLLEFEDELLGQGVITEDEARYHCGSNSEARKREQERTS